MRQITNRTPRYNLDGKRFSVLENTEGGEVSSQTMFEYHQQGDVVWADYSGGDIVRGQLLGHYVSADCLVIKYQHLNSKYVLMTGKCETLVSEDQSGLIYLNETWEWTSGDLSSGTSILVEIEPTE